jgi:drug/metabolite transporter (DMT)-like permease
VIALAGILLKETITRFDIFSLSIALTAAFLVVSGQTMGGGEDPFSSLIDKDSFSYKFAVCGLICNPLLLSYGQIVMRSMRKMHFLVVASYLNLCLWIVSIFMLVMLEEDFISCDNFDATSWLLVTMISVAVICAQTAKFAALQMQEASKLQVFAYI